MDLGDFAHAGADMWLHERMNRRRAARRALQVQAMQRRRDALHLRATVQPAAVSMWPLSPTVARLLALTAVAGMLAFVAGVVVALLDRL